MECYKDLLPKGVNILLGQPVDACAASYSLSISVYLNTINQDLALTAARHACIVLQSRATINHMQPNPC